MARQSRYDKLLADEESTLETAVAKAVAEAERLGGELRRIRDMRKKFAALAKRPSRAKGRVPATNAEPTVATA